MKKYLVILIILIVLLMENFNKQEVLPVFDYNEEEMLIANIIISNLNTNNFYYYFDEQINIVGIYPKVNMLYKDKIGNMFYRFSSNSIKYNINTFIKYYKNTLKKNNYTNDLVLSEYNGINIERVQVYISYDELKQFLDDCNNCSYEKIS